MLTDYRWLKTTKQEHLQSAAHSKVSQNHCMQKEWGGAADSGLNCGFFHIAGLDFF